MKKFVFKRVHYVVGNLFKATKNDTTEVYLEPRQTSNLELFARIMAERH